MIMSKNMKIAKRLATYSVVATELALLSDQRLIDLLKQAVPMGASIGGTSSLLTISETNIFVKKIRLTDVEKKSENIM
jgi:hypothetical protein